MLRANRCGSGPVHHHSEDERLGLLPAGSLNPQKARVMLLLAVLAGWDRNQLQAADHCITVITVVSSRRPGRVCVSAHPAHGGPPMASRKGCTPS